MIGCHIGRFFQVTVAGGSYQEGLTAVRSKPAFGDPSKGRFLFPAGRIPFLFTSRAIKLLL